MKKKLILAAVLMLGGLTACGGGDTPQTQPTNSQPTETAPVSKPAFTLSDKSVTVEDGASAKELIVPIVRVNGHSEAINFTLADAPAGLAVTFQKNPISPSETLIALKFSANGVTPGEYKLNLTGTSPSATAKATITVKVTKPQPIVIPETASVLAYFYSSLGQTDVSWNYVTGAIGYRVDRKCDGSEFVELTSSPVTSMSFTDKSPVLQSVCVYRVRTITKAGISAGKESSSLSTMVETAYVSVASNTTSISVIWGNVTGATSYKIDRKISGGTYIEIASIPAGSQSYSDTAVSVNQTYIYRVRVGIDNKFSAGKEASPFLFTGRSSPTAPACCKYCTSGKPCGDTCIANSKTCRTPGGCACGAERSVIFQRVQDCKKVPAVTLDAQGNEIYLGTVEDLMNSGRALDLFIAPSPN